MGDRWEVQKLRPHSERWIVHDRKLNRVLSDNRGWVNFYSLSNAEEECASLNAKDRKANRAAPKSN